MPAERSCFRVACRTPPPGRRARGPDGGPRSAASGEAAGNTRGEVFLLAYYFSFTLLLLSATKIADPLGLARGSESVAAEVCAAQRADRLEQRVRAQLLPRQVAAARGVHEARSLV